MIPADAAPSLAFKYLLAFASLVAYAAIWQVTEALDPLEGFPDAGLWFHYVVGAVFGALVLGPYAARDRRAPRVLALAAASGVIYYLAVRFVSEGPIGYGVILSFVPAGSMAALLCGLAVVAIAPRPFAWRLVPLLLAAGAAGGAAFELKFAFDQALLVGHAAWQILVCLALHFALRPSPT
jgi:hypothetical protein